MSARNRKALVGLVGAAIAAAVIVVVVQWQPSAPQPFRPFGPGGPGTAGPPVPVLAAVAQIADVPVHLEGVGTARALNTVIVRPQVEGKLLRVNFREGQDVEQGFVLAEIDPIIYQSQLDQALAKKAQDEAQLANAKLDLERYERLVASNSIARQQADAQQALVRQLEAQVQADQAAVDNARAVLAHTRITAPISGRTGLRLVDEGNIVRSGDATGIVVITQIKPISVLFNLPQQQLAKVNLGLAQGSLPVDALDADGGKVVDRGKLLVVDNQVDQTTGTVKLKAEFANDKLALWPGQFVNVRLLIDTLRQVVVVPTAAVQRGPNGTFVYVIDGGAAKVTPVTLTQQDDERAVIASGLTPGQQVVTTGFSRIADGSRVRVSSPDGPGAAPPGGLRPPGPRADNNPRAAPGGPGPRTVGTPGPSQ